MENVGAYEINTVVGRGGMATVYKAYHRRLNRYVAIKMIHHGQHEDPAFRGRFEREAQIVAQLEHPHIVPVYDFSEHEGNPYLVMKYIEGRSLKEMLADGPLKISDLFAIIKPIATAIDYAHGQGVLHRDIKPSNILLDKAGTPYLSDFGLARLAQANESTLSADMVIGTPYYISPEQALGKGEINARADLYSFGVVLYELITGKVPYSDGTPYSIIHDHIYRELPLPTSINPHVPKTAEAVLLRALAKDPTDRYPTATALVNELETALAGDNSAALRQEARHGANETLAKARSLLPVEANVATTIEKAARISRSEVLWSIIGLVVMLAVLFVMVRENFLKEPVPLEEGTQVPTLAVLAGATTTAIPRMTPTRPPNPQPPPALYDVPTLRLSEARTNLTNHPTDPMAYLALARALMEQRRLNSQTEALQTVMEGAAHAEDQVRYALTAGQLAQDAGRMEVAFEIYLEAIRRAEGTAAYPALREQAGAPAYRIASDANFPRLLIMVEISREIDAEDSALALTLLARVLIESDNEELANAALGRALTLESTLAEAHLVLGELRAEQGRTEEASSEWEVAVANTETPGWVRQRASALLQSAVQ